jgi:hypothetical protein
MNQTAIVWPFIWPTGRAVIWLIVMIGVLGVWATFWKIFGLWFSARDGRKGWLAAFTFVNSAGLLEIYYLHKRKHWPFKMNKLVQPS